MMNNPYPSPGGSLMPAMNSMAPMMPPMGGGAPPPQNWSQMGPQGPGGPPMGMRPMGMSPFGQMPTGPPGMPPGAQGPMGGPNPLMAMLGLGPNAGQPQGMQGTTMGPALIQKYMQLLHGAAGANPGAAPPANPYMPTPQGSGLP